MIPFQDENQSSQLETQTARVHVNRAVLSLPNGFATLDCEWRYTYVNQRLLEIIKLPREAVLGKRVWDVFLDQVGIEFFDLINRVMTEQVDVQFEFYYPMADGWVEHCVYPTLDGAAMLMVDITDRKHAEAVLRESEQKYQSLFESIDEGFCTIEVIFDAAQRPIDYRFLQVNPAFFRLTGLPVDAVGKTAREVLPDLEQFWIETYGNVALTGESVRFENESVTMNRWFDVYASRIGDATSRCVAIVFDNITNRKQADQILQRVAKFDAFRLTLTDALRPLGDPIEIQAMASRILGEHLGVNRVLYFEIRGADYVVERDYVNGVMTLNGNYPVDAFGSKLLAARQTGRTVSVSDVATDPNLSPAERSAFAAVQIGAHIDASLIKGGKFIAGLAVHSSAPRVWTPDEVVLVEEVADRTWAAIERARAEAALRESEDKYRSLFTSIDNGFCLVEVLFDADETAYDYRFLEVNAAFEAQSGLVDAVGKTILELVPDLEPQWAALYGEVARSGNATRFEADVPSMNRCFDIRAYPSRSSGENAVAVLFSDISDRQRREANRAILVKIADELVALTDIDATMNRLGETIVRYFGAAQCVFGEFAENLETGTIAHGWYVEGALSLFGTYRVEDFIADEGIWVGETLVVHDTQTDHRVNAENNAALGIGSFILVPLIRDGKWQFLLTLMDSKPRDWRDDEVDTLREIAVRIWTRLERARAEAAVAADLRDTQMLRELAVRLIPEGDFQTLYREILATAIALTHADAGSVQILDAATQELVLLATQGFNVTMTDRFDCLDASSHTSCGMALRNAERTFIDFDVPESEDPDGSLRMHVEAGYLSAQSTPLVGRSGKAIGMISTHWRKHHRPSDRELRFLDLLARQAADTIEKQQIAVALRDREEQLRLATEASKLGLWFWDLETDCLTWTEQCKALFGLPADMEMSYTVFLCAVHPDDREYTQAAVTQAINDRTDYDIEYRTCWPDGSIHWIAAKGSCTYDTTGKPLQMMGVALNITDRKQMETQLEERNQELDRFVHIVSHDLKAPLRGIANLSQWIEEDITELLSEDTQQQMALLRDRVCRMEAMINGLLNYARVGLTDGMIETVGVEALLTEVVDSIAPPPTFQIAIAPGMPTLHTKRLLLSQVFSNLISNAIKHHDRPDGAIRISAQDQRNFYEFAVADDGPGISPENHSRIFMIFQAVNPQKSADSSGIGLSIVKKIVEAEAGTIRLESHVDEGTTFYFTWPKTV